MRYLLFMLLAVPQVLPAQPRPKEGVWLTLNAPIDLSSKWQIHNDYSFRTLSMSANPLQYLFRSGLRYRVNDQFSVAAGVALVITRTSFNKDNQEFGNEFRVWQEVLRKYVVSPKTNLQLRFRAEQRFFEATKRRDDFVANRFRIRINWHQDISEYFSLILAEEYMQQYAQHDFVFDQNRLITALGCHLDRTSQLQFGYMWFLLPQQTSQHILNITFQKRFQLYGKNKRA